MFLKMKWKYLQNYFSLSFGVIIIAKALLSLNRTNVIEPNSLVVIGSLAKCV